MNEKSLQNQNTLSLFNILLSSLLVYKSQELVFGGGAKNICMRKPLYFYKFIFCARTSKLYLFIFILFYS